MLRLRALLLSLLAVLALMSPSFAVGLHIGLDDCGPYVSSAPDGEPVWSSGERGTVRGDL